MLHAPTSRHQGVFRITGNSPRLAQGMGALSLWACSPFTAKHFDQGEIEDPPVQGVEPFGDGRY